MPSRVDVKIQFKIALKIQSFLYYSIEEPLHTIIHLKDIEDLNIMEKFIITPKEDKTVTMTIRIDRTIQEKYNELSARTNRSRNELIGMALQFALDHMEVKG